jgi:hypothetical protein
MTPRRTRVDRLIAWSPVVLLGGLAALTYWPTRRSSRPGRASTEARAMILTTSRTFRAVTFDAPPGPAPLTARRAQALPG